MASDGGRVWSGGFGGGEVLSCGAVCIRRLAELRNRVRLLICLLSELVKDG